MMKWFAHRLNEKARRCDDDVRAEALYRRAAKRAPDWSVPLFNLGLLKKRQRLWPESLDLNRRAAVLSTDDEAALWNMGIAATALGDWPAAREAWTRFGIEIPAGEGPIEMNLGLTPIRITPDSTPEVVWCDRIDPARARVRSIPLPDSGRRYDDLLLHDGEPKGQRRLRDRLVSVFNEIELLEPSAYATFEVVVDAPVAEELDACLERLYALNVVAEDWTGSIEALCVKCSEGVPHEHHERVPPPWTPTRQIGVAALGRAELEAALEDVLRPAGLEIESIEQVL